MDDPDRPFRCVLWTPPGEPVPSAMAEVLHRRGITPVVVASPYAAAARACADPHETAVLLLVHPDRLAERDRVLRAARSRVESLIVWIFDERANPPLARFVEPEMVAAPSQPAPQALAPVVRPDAVRAMPAPGAARPASPPALRLSGEGPLPGEPEPGDRDDDGPGLTDAELAMLLGEDSAPTGGEDVGRAGPR